MSKQLQLEDFLAECSSAQKERWDVLLADAKAGAKKKKLSGEVASLIHEFLGDSLTDKEKGRITGPLIGAFWKQIPKADKKPKKPALPSFEEQLIELRSKVPFFPYPMGLKLSEFVWEVEKFEKGVASTNFPFLLAALNGLALRLLASICITEYVSHAKAPDARLNQKIVEGLRLPSDGTWKQLLEQLLSFANDDQSLLPHTAIIGEYLRQKVPKKGVKKGVNVLQMTQELVQFRNALLHGSEEPAEDELQALVETTVSLYRQLSFLCDWSWFVLEPHHVLVAKGLSFSTVSPTSFDWPSSKTKMTTGSSGQLRAAGLKKGQLYTYSSSLDDAQPLSLFPLLHVTTDLGLDVAFFNSFHDDTLEYISYRHAVQLDHRRMGLAKSTFYQFLRSIPTAPLPVEARIDFRGISAFHAEQFVGRSGILQAIEAFLEGRLAPYGVITALAGMGKTALFAMLHQRHLERREWPSLWLPLWHFCSVSADKSHPVLFLRSIMAQLDACLGLEPREYPTSLDLLRVQFSERIRALPEELAAHPPGTKVILFVDALDEAIGTMPGELSIPSLLPEPALIPDCLLCLISFRVDESGSNEQIERILPVPPQYRYYIPGCDPLRGLSHDEVEELLQLTLAERKMAEGLVDAIWRTSSSQAEGQSGPLADPFVLRFLTDGLKEGTIDPERPETVPSSLVALFEQFWNQLPVDHDFFLHRILGFLAVMPDMGSDSFFASMFSQLPELQGEELISPDDVAERRREINKLLLFSGDRYRLFHSRFRDYVVRRFRKTERLHQLHKPLLSISKKMPAANAAYGFRYLTFHLKELATSDYDTSATFVDEYWELIWEDAFFHQKNMTLQRTDLLFDDFLRAFDAFMPDPSVHQETECWERVAKCFHLAKRTHLVLNQAQVENVEQLDELITMGEMEPLIQTILRSPQPLRRTLRLLLGAIKTREAGHDPARLFSLMYEIGSPQLSSSQLPFFQELLQKAEAPSVLHTLVQSWVED